MSRIATLIVVLGLASSTVGLAAAGTLDDVRARGKLICGVNPQFAGFAVPDENGVWQGFNVDMCKAIAAAVQVDTEFKPLASNERFLSLANGVADVLTMQNTWTMARDTKLGVSFVETPYYDIQGFLVRTSVGATKLAEMDGASACVISGSTAEVNLATLFKERGMSYTPITFKTGQESRLAYGAGRCDFIMGDRSNLANMRVQLENPDDHTLLEEGIGREPLSLAVRQGDEQWLKVVRYTYNALLIAELYGITQANVDEMAASATQAEMTNLLGKSGSLGEDLGLDNAFAVRAIKAVGNYSEVFERHLGTGTRMGLGRGLNALWIDGGLQYAPPFK